MHYVIANNWIKNAKIFVNSRFRQLHWRSFKIFNFHSHEGSVSKWISFGNLSGKPYRMLYYRIYICNIQQVWYHKQYILPIIDDGSLWRIYYIFHVCIRKYTNASEWQHNRIYWLHSSKCRFGHCSCCIRLLDSEDGMNNIQEEFNLWKTDQKKRQNDIMNWRFIFLVVMVVSLLSNQSSAQIPNVLMMEGELRVDWQHLLDIIIQAKQR